jgi:hypothetical protein
MIPLRLNIDTQFDPSKSKNYRRPVWPPTDDFPMVIDDEGTVISVFGDSIWDLSPWHTTRITLNFGDGPQRMASKKITKENANVFRLITAWWLWGPYNTRTAVTLRKYHAVLRPLFIICSDAGICATQLHRFPRVADLLPSRMSANLGNIALSLLHALFEQRDSIGFTLLDLAGIRRFAASLPKHRQRQTAYIPHRIWAYQIGRLRAALDDFNNHRAAIEQCYHFCLKAYESTWGSLEVAWRQHGPGTRSAPFARRPEGSKPAMKGRVEGLGPFIETARKFGIEELLKRWHPRAKPDEMRVTDLSRYFTMINRVGIAYILNFSMMRIHEAWDLQVGCLHIEEDEQLGKIFLIKGKTRKTLHDDDASWITSPTVKIAIDALTCVASLRTHVIETCGDGQRISGKMTSYLIQSAYEPWGKPHRSPKKSMHFSYPAYAELLIAYPQLFEPEQLRITSEDLGMVRLLTPSLDNKSFAIGQIWPLAWHQLRRTAAVNMQASGLVSELSAQYQLKHASRAMSLYYGQGYSNLSLADSARTEYVRTMYEIMGLEINDLFSRRYVSPHGADRKAAILAPVSETDSKLLSQAAKAGKVAWRLTLLGGCTRRGPCEFGGVDNIVRCGGGDGSPPCADALFDRNRVHDIVALRGLIGDRLRTTEPNSPYYDSLRAQRRAVENALNVINKEQ